jgi:sugar/nucleoside kinase (ribokinase family)
MSVACVPSSDVTSFDIGDDGAPKRLLARATQIRRSDIPESWRGARLVHLAPIADEIDRDVPSILTERSCVVATAQGWLRRVSSDGTITSAPEELAELPLESFAAMVISIEDVAGRVDLVRRAANRVPLLALTRGRQGCTLFVRGDEVEIEPVEACVLDSVGAGDIFAAAFFVRLDEIGDPVRSARFASSAAALSVEGRGVEGSVANRERIEERSRVACRP